MDLRKLKTLIDLVQASGIAEIEINEEGDHVRIVNRRLSRSRRQLRPRPLLHPPQPLLLLLPLRPLTPRAVLR